MIRALTPEQAERFRADGYLVIPDVLSPRRLATLRAVVERAEDERQRYAEQYPDLVAEMHAAEARGEVVHASEWTHVVMQMYQLWERYPEAREHTLDPDLAELARGVLGVPALRLWFDQAMVKPPGGRATPMHQDNTYAPVDLEPGGLVTIWAPLTTVDDAMGCLRYVPGSHRDRRLPPIPLRGFDDVRNLLDDPASPERAVPAEIPEGGVVVHHGDVLHGAGDNVSSVRRAAVLTCYFPDGSRRGGKLRQWVIDRDGVTVGGKLRGPGLPLVTRGQAMESAS